MKKIKRITTEPALRFSFGLALIGSLLILISGCSANPPLRTYDSLSRAMYVVEQSNTPVVVDFAADDQQHAAENLRLALDAYDNGRYESARRLAEQAQLQAQIATTRAQVASLQTMLGDRATGTDLVSASGGDR